VEGLADRAALLEFPQFTVGQRRARTADDVAARQRPDAIHAARIAQRLVEGNFR